MPTSTVAGPIYNPITFVDAINNALIQAMADDSHVICFGLGADDPKEIFGTTKGLRERFGPQRVFDMPTSENGMTGVAIGAAINGLRPVMTHQRLDFFLLAMDQLVNHAAKWHYMFGGKRSIPITIRTILGRGWGQGPTHAQSLQSWFAHIPGLKIVMPSTPMDAGGLLMASILDDNPVIFLEHRWLYNQVADGQTDSETLPIGKANVMLQGEDITLVSYSFMAIETLRAALHLQQKGISCEVIDLRTIKPMDVPAITRSVQKTGKLLVIDNSSPFCSVGSEIVCTVVSVCFGHLRQAPQKLAFPDVPVPTSPALTKVYYPRASDIAEFTLRMLKAKFQPGQFSHLDNTPHDVPGDWFKGPF